jgi:Ran GTPase-activating protein (RanGAP) involved in mRNA processing and transport
MKKPSTPTRAGHLNLQGAGIDAVRQQLADISPHEITFLDLSDNEFRDAEMAALAPQLAKLSQLTSLVLGGNYFGPGGMAALAPQLAKLSQLTSLGLSFNNFGPAGMAALAPHLAELSQLTSLGLGDNELGPEGMAALAPHLAKLSQLTSLDLRSNQLGEAGIAALAPHLAHLSQLTSLELGANDLGLAGMAALAPQLAHLSQLTSLGLSLNILGPDGMAALAPHLAKLSQLTSLKLGGNDLGPEGMAALAPQLAKLSQLTSFDLRNNTLGPDGMAAIAAPLAHLTQLTSLDLGYNNLGPEGMAIIEPILKRNKRIAALKSLIDNALETFNIQADKQTAHNKIQNDLDELYSIAQKMEEQNNLQPTVLYDDYYHLACRFALTGGDFNAAMASAGKMSSLPVRTLAPYCNEEHPLLFARVTRQLAPLTAQPLAMATLLGILLQSGIKLAISDNERYLLLERIAACADPERKDTAVQTLRGLIKRDYEMRGLQLSKTDQPTKALATPAPDLLLSAQLLELIEKYSFAHIISSVIKPFSGNNNDPPNTFFSGSAYRRSLNSLCQHFQDPQTSLEKSIAALLTLLNNNTYIQKDPSARILLSSLADYLELEHSPDQDLTSLRDRIYSVLTKDPQEKSKPLMDNF